MSKLARNRWWRREMKRRQTDQPKADHGIKDKDLARYVANIEGLLVMNRKERRNTGVRAQRIGLERVLQVSLETAKPKRIRPATVGETLALVGRR